MGWPPARGMKIRRWDMKKESRLWPVRGGRWNKRWLALGQMLQLALLTLALYCLSWTLAPYF